MKKANMVVIIIIMFLGVFSYFISYYSNKNKAQREYEKFRTQLEISDEYPSNYAGSYLFNYSTIRILLTDISDTSYYEESIAYQHIEYEEAAFTLNEMLIIYEKLTASELINPSTGKLIEYEINIFDNCINVYDYDMSSDKINQTFEYYVDDFSILNFTSLRIAVPN